MRSNGECDLHPQPHPIVDKVRRLDDFHSFDYISYESVMDSLEIPLFAFLLQLVSRVIFFVSQPFTISMSMMSSLLDDVLRD